MLRLFVLSLGLTLLVEAIVGFLWGMRGKREFQILLLVNVLTNPVVVYLYFWGKEVLGIPTTSFTLVLEIAAILVEWMYYRRCSKQLKRPFLFSVIANAISYTVGCLVNLAF